MKNRSLHSTLVLVAFIAVLGTVITGCTSAKPVAPPTSVTTTPGASAAPQSAAPANFPPLAVNYFSTTGDKITA
jgi:predicted component of type VI protein secretion system